MTRSQAHQCDDLCVCPVHLTPLLYAPVAGDHACQNADCEHGHGGFNPGAALLEEAIRKYIARRGRSRWQGLGAPALLAHSDE
ncbi:hypothetical protein OG618_36985 (plasmid) [Kitasatospora sp. NBC_01246]|uniref:hypothetical protein n=1 Tax=Kitasatospora sp. NBC_01246 TaxID=2903570 RepID=UPI002E3631E8|nr:hypothetical protein [Kitasatospora sp. NBC_01246]